VSIAVAATSASAMKTPVLLAMAIPGCDFTPPGRSGPILSWLQAPSLAVGREACEGRRGCHDQGGTDRQRDRRDALLLFCSRSSHIASPSWPPATIVARRWRARCCTVASRCRRAARAEMAEWQGGRTTNPRRWPSVDAVRVITSEPLRSWSQVEWRLELPLA
jgi:hypothetical protein